VNKLVTVDALLFEIIAKPAGVIRLRVTDADFRARSLFANGEMLASKP
jgi:hypothetical protein